MVPVAVPVLEFNWQDDGACQKSVRCLSDERKYGRGRIRLENDWFLFK